MVRNGNRVVSGSVCWRKMSWGKRKCAGEAPGRKMRHGRAAEGDSGVASLKHGPWEAVRVVCYSPLHISTVWLNSLLKLVDMKHSRKEQPSSEWACSSLTVTPQAWLSWEGLWDAAAVSDLLGQLKASGRPSAWCLLTRCLPEWVCGRVRCQCLTLLTIQHDLQVWLFWNALHVS